ncbi:MAG: hypothetical protein ABJZ55_22940 [Fuerstiella sp.]
MKNNLNLWIIFAAISIFAMGCSEERSVAPAGQASPTELSSTEPSSTEETDDGSATKSTGDVDSEAGSRL